MYHNNSSSSSLVSRQSFASLKKDKELPPIPPIAQPVIATGPEDPILQAKTLKRKNFKQLSLSATSSSSLQALILTLALGLTLGLALNLALATQVEAPDTISDLSGYAEKRNRHRPEKLVNFSLDGNITANSTANSTASGKNPSSPSVVACQLSGLELNKCHTSASQTSLQLHLSSTSSVNAASSNGIAASIGASTASGTTHTQYVSRKRQTVISSISPTKSITSIPSSISSANSASAHKLSFNIEASPLMEDVSLPLLTTSQLRLNNNDLITLKELGAGNSGTVSKILHVPSQRIMAKKIIHIDLKSMVQTQIIRELRILHECRSPYIVEFYGAFINNNNTIVMCMEYCNCGSLDKILQLCDNGQFPNPVLKKLTYVMLSGLTYLFKTHKIVHRDIKPQNVLMNHKGNLNYVISESREN